MGADGKKTTNKPGQKARKRFMRLKGAKGKSKGTPKGTAKGKGKGTKERKIWVPKPAQQSQDHSKDIDVESSSSSSSKGPRTRTSKDDVERRIYLKSNVSVQKRSTVISFLQEALYNANNYQLTNEHVYSWGDHLMDLAEQKTIKF